MIKLFVGLGNPGAEYEHKQLKAPLQPEKNFHGWAARTTFQGQTLWLLKPATFMNLSGKSVAALAKFYKIAPENMLVAHDELDLVPGDAKLKLGGGHAGHNGLRDIHAQMGTDAYWRLRLGIGHPGVKSEVVHWVLKKPAPEQRILIDTSIDRSLQALAFLVSGEMEKAMQMVHTSKPPRPKPPRPAAASPLKEGASHEKNPLPVDPDAGSDTA